MTEEKSSRQRLEQAVERLEGALGRLVQKSAGGGSASVEGSGELAAEFERLKAENDSLRADLETTRAAHRELQEVTEAVSNRLDATIDELSAMLGE